VCGWAIRTLDRLGDDASKFSLPIALSQNRATLSGGGTRAFSPARETGVEGSCVSVSNYKKGGVWNECRASGARLLVLSYPAVPGWADV
jgi:hypothetical protein